MTPPSSIASTRSSDILSTPALTEDHFHPDFCSSNSDVVIVSCEGVKFGTHSFVLKSASGIFRATLSLPQTGGASANNQVITLSEDARTINAILRMISGMEIPPLDNFSDLEKVLLAAKKWEMPGPPSIIHRMVIPPVLLDDPVRFYALACRTGWNDAIAVAAAHTLDVDLQHEETLPILRKMESNDVLKLIDLRTRRRDAILDFFLAYPISGCLSHLPHLDRPSASDHELSIQWQWKALIFTAFIAMDRHPSGKTLLGPNSVLQADLDDMRNTRCPELDTGTAAFDVDALEKALQKQVSELPITI
ncbi:hypothetical protein BU17DRAFT_63673 [Hysterangium stoloniferum]|nr:hypothetical protein BU17DRAFT_63673 [Hysterangium stoloniferum]